MEQKFNDRTTVRQSKPLNNAHFNLSALSLDILYLLFAQVQQEDREFKEYCVTFNELERRLGKRIDRKYVDRVCIELLTNPVKIQKPNSTILVNFVSSAEYASKEGWIKLKLSDKLKEELISIYNHRNFSLASFLEVRKLKSQYSKRIYALLKQFEISEYRIIYVNKLEKILGIEGKYKYADFKKRVIKIAQDQISKETEISFSFNEVKVGRKVSKIEFFIYNKRKANQAEKIKGKKVKKKACSGVEAAQGWLNKQRGFSHDDTIIEGEVIIDINDTKAIKKREADIKRNLKNFQDKEEVPKTEDSLTDFINKTINQ